MAPDKFKGSLSAAAVAEAMTRGIHRAASAAEVRSIAVADGGEGTLAAVAAAGALLVPTRVTGPTGRPVDTHVAVLDRTAYVELADCCGLQRLPGGKLAPLRAGTRGAGEAVLCALAQDVDTVVVGVGGSASTDGGIGFLDALGFHPHAQDGAPLAATVENLHLVTGFTAHHVPEHLASIPLVIATDVSNPMIGPEGAAHVFGPQKGANPEQVRFLEDQLAHLAAVYAAEARDPELAERPGTGAAGGIAAAAVALLGASIKSGAQAVLQLSRAAETIDWADLVFIGEGSLDEQTLRGKAPSEVAALAQAHRTPAYAVAGRIDAPLPALRARGIADQVSLVELARLDQSDTYAHAERLIASATAQLVERHRFRSSRQHLEEIS
ncbi:glycerate kinase [Klenkia soli]|uniref:glycerate kinase n=1 Tax=Klenkia soli TaxID=1052260 RepID=UPI0013F4EE6E|nr:glycerate kinase [Klenkia soli]